MQDWVTLNEEHRVLICNKCKAAVRPGNKIESHFRHEHNMKGQQLAEILSYFEHQPLQDPVTATLPADGSRPIPGLIVYRQGLSCSVCRFLTTSHDVMTKHWRANATHTGITAQYTEVKLQSWCKGRYTRYWVVQLAWETTRSLRAAPPTTESAMDAIIAESTAKLKEEDEKRLLRGDRQEGFDHDSTWVKEMMWVRHIGSRSLAEIYNATQFTQPKDQGAKTQLEGGGAEVEERRVLKLLGESFDREVDRCSWRLDSVPKETLKCLHSIEAGKSHSKPFGFTAQDDSWMRYKSLGYRYLAFCWRAHRMGREEAGNRLGAYFLDDQWSMLGDVVEELDEVLNSGQGAFNGSHDDTGFFSDDSEEDDEQYEGGEGARGASGTKAPSTIALDRAVFQFIVGSIKVRVGGKMYSNGLLCFCAAIGIRLHPLGYTEAYLYTGMLAALLWISRLFFLEAGFEGQPRELEEVKVEALQQFQKEHEMWMCLGTYTVASKIISWMAYGKGHRNKTGATPTVRWPNRWNTDRLSSIMIRLMQADIKLRLGTKRYRIMAIEFGRKIQGLTMKQTDAEGGDEDDHEGGIEYDPISGELMDVRGSWNIVWDLQSTHSTRMARLGYATHVGMPGQLQPQMIASYRGVSRLWH
ncbi:unnamed protein product [Clonostachys chloroleuca]|uniref:C2H2-type domain-containing protein n=1 Tax=Clonostachys chloroleuca TaxID=1926264 RepID=A0AA35M5P9_9HYPO|nr:unnamed protein product [Clonostachys chloroleuca]